MPRVVRLIDMVFPGDTNHHGTLFGGVALAHMDKVAFLASTRHTRAVIAMLASDHVDFTLPVVEGEMVELVARVETTGCTSTRIDVELWAKNLLTTERRRAAGAEFVMVAVDQAGRPMSAARSSV